MYLWPKRITHCCADRGLPSANSQNPQNLAKKHTLRCAGRGLVHNLNAFFRARKGNLEMTFFSPCNIFFFHRTHFARQYNRYQIVTTMLHTCYSVYSVRSSRFCFCLCTRRGAVGFVLNPGLDYGERSRSQLLLAAEAARTKPPKIDKVQNLIKI